MTVQSNREAIDEIWELFRETDAKFKETDVRFKETDVRFKETDVRFKETDAKFKETDDKLRRLEGLFGNQWGRLLEALVKPSVLKLFQERGIGVHYLSQRVLAQHNGSQMEVDLLMENGSEVIAVEVKSQLKIEFVDDFLGDLAEFHRYFPRFNGYHLYGAVAGLDLPPDVARYCYKRGLFVLSITGDEMVSILNDEKFTPRDFGTNP